MKSLMPLCFTFCLLTCFSSCKSPTEPKEAVDPGLDTTSHAMTFQVYEFGEWPSYFHCSHAVSDTEIYAGGEIVVGQNKIDGGDSIANLFRWNGHEWSNQSIVLDEVIRYNPFTTGKSISRISSIFSTKTSVWFVLSNYFIIKRTKDKLTIFRNRYSTEYLGSTIVDTQLPLTNELWGSSDDNMFFVGDSGRIVHYNGKTWEAMNSPTKMPLVSIYGNEDGSELFAAGVNYQTGKGCLLRFTTQTGWKMVIETDFYNRFPDFISGVYYITGVWGITDKQSEKTNFFAFGNSIIQRFSDGNWKSIHDDNIWKAATINSMAGTGLNDLFYSAIGGLGGAMRFVHFNGKTWYTYKEISDQPEYSYFGKLALSKHFLISTGVNFTKGNGYILMGTR